MTNQYLRRVCAVGLDLCPIRSRMRLVVWKAYVVKTTTCQGRIQGNAAHLSPGTGSEQCKLSLSDDRTGCRRWILRSSHVARCKLGSPLGALERRSLEGADARRADERGTAVSTCPRVSPASWPAARMPAAASAAALAPWPESTFHTPTRSLSQDRISVQDTPSLLDKR